MNALRDYRPMEQRIVRLTPSTYAELLQKLLPEERWYELEMKGHVMYVPVGNAQHIRELVIQHE